MVARAVTLRYELITPYIHVLWLQLSLHSIKSEVANFISMNS